MAQLKLSGLAEVYRRAQLYRLLGPRPQTKRSERDRRIEAPEPRQKEKT